MKVPIYMQGQDDNLYQDELNQTLQDALSDNGWKIPNQTTANITQIAPTMPNGTIWYDSDTNQLKYIKSGVVTVL